MPESPATPADFPSQAHYLFDRYTGPDALAAIQAMPGQTPRFFETNWLEFKSGIWKDEDGKANWSKALGSFANGGGGVVIWGVQADGSGGGRVDCVQGIVPVPDVNVLVSRLKQLHPVATDPPVKGLEIKALLLPGSETAGFVICLIPESESKPHRSEFGKDGNARRFYLRIGDSTQECSVPFLRQLFYPRYSSKLTATLQLKAPGLSKNVASAMNGNVESKRLYSVKIHNAGQSSIFDMWVRLGCQGHDVYAEKIVPISVFKDTPGRIMEGVGTLKTEASLHPSLDFEFDVFVHVETGTRIHEWTIDVFARDMNPKRAVILHESLHADRWREVTVDCV